MLRVIHKGVQTYALVTPRLSAAVIPNSRHFKNVININLVESCKYQQQFLPRRAFSIDLQRFSKPKPDDKCRDVVSSTLDSRAEEACEEETKKYQAKPICEEKEGVKVLQTIEICARDVDQPLCDPLPELDKCEEGKESSDGPSSLMDEMPELIPWEERYNHKFQNVYLLLGVAISALSTAWFCHSLP